MDEMLLTQFGVAGVIIAGLLWDRFRILKENADLQKEVRDLFRENADTLKTLASSLNKLAEKD